MEHVLPILCAPNGHFKILAIQLVVIALFALVCISIINQACPNMYFLSFMPQAEILTYNQSLIQVVVKSLFLVVCISIINQTCWTSIPILHWADISSNYPSLIKACCEKSVYTCEHLNH